LVIWRVDLEDFGVESRHQRLHSWSFNVLHDEFLVLFETVAVIDLGDGTLLRKHVIRRDDKLSLDRDG
jgi:hypothetical protein